MVKESKVSIMDQEKEPNTERISTYAITRQIGSDISDALKSVAKTCGNIAFKCVAYPIAGQLSSKKQERLENRLGKEWYSVTDSLILSHAYNGVGYGALGYIIACEKLGLIEAQMRQAINPFVTNPALVDELQNYAFAISLFCAGIGGIGANMRCYDWKKHKIARPSLLGMAVDFEYIDKAIGTFARAGSKRWTSYIDGVKSRISQRDHR